MSLRPDIDAVVARYCEAWNAPDPDLRWSLVHALAAPDVLVVDPYSDKPIQGQAAFTAYLGMFQETAGHSLEATGPPDHHHGWMRAPWRLVTPAGDEFVRGLLVGQLDREMRFTHIVHFLDA